MIRTCLLSPPAIRLCRIAAVVIIFLPHFPLRAALQVYESFDYVAGQQLKTKNGGTGFGTYTWADGSTPGNEDLIAPGSLAYSGVQTAGNSLVMVSPTDSLTPNDTRRITTIKPAAGTTTWVSFLFALESTAALASTDYASFTLSPVTTASGGPYFGVFNDPVGAPGDKVFGIGSSPTSPLSPSSVSFVEDQTYLLAARIDWSAGNETISLYVNPLAGATEGLLSPAAVTTDVNIANGNGTNQLISIGLFAAGVGTEWAFDEIRIGTTYADAVLAAAPEPSPFVLLSLVAGSVLLWRRRPRHAGRANILAAP
jgi:hypothetical protein